MTTDTKPTPVVTEAQLTEQIELAVKNRDYEKVAALSRQVITLRSDAQVKVQELLNREILADVKSALAPVVPRVKASNKPLRLTVDMAADPLEVEARGLLKGVLSKYDKRITEVGGVARILIDLTGESDLWDVKCGTATTRAAAGTKGAGPRGKMSETYGRTLDSIFREYATPEEISEVERLSALGRNLIPGTQTRADSAAYSAKAKVVKRARDAGLIAPVAAS